MNITWNADNDPLSILPGIMIIDGAGTQILWSLICYLSIFICHICWYHHLDLYRFMIIHIYSLCFIIYHICCLYLFNIFELIYIYHCSIRGELGCSRELPTLAPWLGPDAPCRACGACGAGHGSFGVFGSVASVAQSWPLESSVILS